MDPYGYYYTELLVTIQLMRVSCIIPAFNESKRIEGVLKSVVNHRLVDEIIVIDDGSTDWPETKAILDSFSNIHAIHLENNCGKTAALVRGISSAQGEYVLLLDADLIGLSESHVTQLLEPVLNGQVAMTLSMRKNSPWIDRKLGIDYISGERVFKRALLDEYLSMLETMPRFGFETFLNTIVIQKRLPIMVVNWPDVESPYKVVKHGFVEGVVGDFGMVRDMAKVVPFYKLPVIFLQLRQLMVKAK